MIDNEEVVPIGIVLMDCGHVALTVGPMDVENLDATMDLLNSDVFKERVRAAVVRAKSEREAAELRRKAEMN